MPKRDLRLNTDLVEERTIAVGIDSTAELARRLDHDRTYVARVLTGDRTLQPSFVLRLAAVLGVRPAALILPDDPDRIEDDLRAEARAS